MYIHLFRKLLYYDTLNKRHKRRGWPQAGQGKNLTKTLAFIAVALWAVIAVAAMLLPLAAAFQVFDGLQVVCSGVLRGAGDTRIPLLLYLLGFWICGIPLSLWLAFGAGSSNMTRHLACSSGTVMAFSAASSVRTSIPSAWRASAAFAADFLVFFLMPRLQLGFAPVSDDGV